MDRQIAYNPGTPVVYIVLGTFNPDEPVFKEIRKAAPKRLYLASPLIDIKSIEPAIDWECKIQFRQNNKQSAYPEFVFQAINWFFNHEPEGIVLENYCQPLEGFFDFCSTMLERYRNDSRIGHISGKDYRRKERKTGYSYRFSSLTNTCGWASWRRAWQEVRTAVKTCRNFRESGLLAGIAAFRPFKNQWQIQFDRYLRGRQTAGRLKIPRIIHQIYEDPAGSPETLLYLAGTWKKHHPEWEYRFWDKQAMEDFLTTHFPDFIPCYHGFPFNVQRWDAIRYLILYQMGGMYVDFDYECIRPLDALLLDTTCCMGMETSVNANLYNKPLIIGNALMASIPGHNYFKAVIQEMKDCRGPYKNNADMIMETTGPFMVTRAYEKYRRKKEVTLLSADLVAPLTVRETRLIVRGRAPEEIVEKAEKAFAVHYFGGSWVEQVNRWKT